MAITCSSPTSRDHWRSLPTELQQLVLAELQLTCAEALVAHLPVLLGPQLQGMEPELAPPKKNVEGFNQSMNVLTEISHGAFDCGVLPLLAEAVETTQKRLAQVVSREEKHRQATGMLDY